MAFPGISNTPTNPNLLPPNKFSLQVAALPEVQYWCQTVNIPGISIGEAIRSTPFIDLFSPGDKAILGPLSITFLVDEDLKSWTSLFNWMAQLTFIKNFNQYSQLRSRPDAWAKPMPQYSDISLSILNTKQIPNIRIKFINCFPVSLSDIIVSTTSTPEDTITSDATFRYDYYDIELV